MQNSDGGTLRPSGIRPVGNLPWGAHICAFYDTKNDLLETNCLFLEGGLGANEFCLWQVSHPINPVEAAEHLEANIENFGKFVDAHQIEIVPGIESYVRGEKFEIEQITDHWNDKFCAAMARGFEGMRITGTTYWAQMHRWKTFAEFERCLDGLIAGKKMVVLCNYSLREEPAVDLLDVTRVHNVTVIRRNGDWEFLQTPELKLARQEIDRLRNGISVLSRPFPGHDELTSKELMVLAQVVSGASSKEAARALGVSHRTIDFHRSNIMRKLGARNVADLVAMVVGEDGSPGNNTSAASL